MVRGRSRGTRSCKSTKESVDAVSQYQSVGSPSTYDVTPIREMEKGGRTSTPALLLLSGLRPAPSLCRFHVTAGPSQAVVSLPASAATTTTAATAATTATTATRRSPVFARPCLVDGQGTTREFSAVKGLDGRFGGGVIRHLDEAEASRLSGIPVGDYSCRLHGTVRRESALKLFLSHLERKIAHIDVHARSLLKDSPHRCLASHAFYNRLVQAQEAGRHSHRVSESRLF